MIKRRDLPLYALRSFEAAARLQSLTAAAEELGVTYSAISHQIRKLEQLVALDLFDRRHKPLMLTARGEALFASVRDSFDQLAQATEGLERAEPGGELTISSVPGLGTNWLIPELGEFIRTFRSVDIHITTHFWHREAQNSDADLSIVYGSAEHPGKKVTRLGQSQFFPVCSPRIVDALAKPKTLAGMVLLHDHTEETWSRWLLEAGFDSIQRHQNMYFDNANMSLEAARRGLGVAMGDRVTVKSDLAEGRLIRLFDKSVPAIHPYYIVTKAEDKALPVARALEAWLIDRFSD
ncbi:MAG: LysR substrate-binding domain-containing protein [Roseovarius indicus]